MPSIKNMLGSALDHLGESIVAGRYAQGAALPPEPLLGEELGVSRTVVREAVKSLSAKGLLSTGPKVGTRVLPREAWNWFDPAVVGWQSKAGITPEFLRDLQDLRRIIEPQAVRLAAQRASAAQVQAMRNAFNGMSAAALHGQGDYVQHDVAFHAVLLQASGNLLLVQMSKALSALLQTSFEVSTQSASGPVGSLPLHGQVLEAVAAGDADAAERAITRIIDGAQADIEQVLSPISGSRNAKLKAVAPNAALRRNNAKALGDKRSATGVRTARTARTVA
jgi:DNA-binding FadR family transcriptional regulator